MPIPSNAQAAINTVTPWATDSRSRPATNTRFEMASRLRPPNVSMACPTRGPSRPEMTSAPDSAPNT
ncbi:hypothetical protein ABIF66_005591 [Bradyrhizobium japonicum]